MIQLRNEITHFKPATQSTGERNKIAQRLEAKFESNPLMKGMGNPHFPDHVLGSPCARWAVDSCVQLADAVSQELGIEPNYKRAQF